MACVLCLQKLLIGYLSCCLNQIPIFNQVVSSVNVLSQVARCLCWYPRSGLAGEVGRSIIKGQSSSRASNLTTKPKTQEREKEQIKWCYCVTV